MRGYFVRYRHFNQFISLFGDGLIQYVRISIFTMKQNVRGKPPTFRTEEPALFPVWCGLTHTYMVKEVFNECQTVPIDESTSQSA